MTQPPNDDRLTKVAEALESFVRYFDEVRQLRHYRAGEEALVTVRTLIAERNADVPSAEGLETLKETISAAMSEKLGGNILLCQEHAIKFSLDYLAPMLCLSPSQQTGEFVNIAEGDPNKPPSAVHSEARAAITHQECKELIRFLSIIDTASDDGHLVPLTSEDIEIIRAALTSPDKPEAAREPVLQSATPALPSR